MVRTRSRNVGSHTRRTLLSPHFLPVDEVRGKAREVLFAGNLTNKARFTPYTLADLEARLREVTHRGDHSKISFQYLILITKSSFGAFFSYNDTGTLLHSNSGNAGFVISRQKLCGVL